MTSDLSNVQKQVIQSLAKTISSLHKRQWINDDKKQHYRNILKSMSTQETYNDDTLQRLQKKLDRLKQKHVDMKRDVPKQAVLQQHQQEQDTQDTKKSQIIQSLNMKNNGQGFHVEKNNKQEKYLNIPSHHDYSNMKRHRNHDLSHKTSPLENVASHKDSTGRVCMEKVTHEDSNEPSISIMIAQQQRDKIVSNSNRQGNNTRHPSTTDNTFHHRKSQGGMVDKVHATSRLPLQALTPSNSVENQESNESNSPMISGETRNLKLPISPPSRKKLDKSLATVELPSIIMNPSAIQGKLSRDEIKRLFIEMCAFARLQFVQPPCCLSCTLSNLSSSTHHPDPPRYCSSYVVWRRNANLKIHPQNMNENTMFVSCAAAQALIKGETVYKWKWNAEEKIFEECC